MRAILVAVLLCVAGCGPESSGDVSPPVCPDAAPVNTVVALMCPGAETFNYVDSTSGMTMRACVWMCARYEGTLYYRVRLVYKYEGQWGLWQTELTPEIGGCSTVCVP